MLWARKAVGMAAASAVLVLGASSDAHKPVIAITVDYLPVHSVLPAGTTRQAVADDIVAALRAAGSPPVTGFVNGASLAGDPATAGVLASWAGVGLMLGNHGWAHRSLDEIGVAGFEDELVRNEPLLSATMRGRQWRWFRYPFVAEGRDPAVRAGARAVLARHGYRIAAVTMSFGDYAWNPPYARCVAQGDAPAIADLERRYLAAAAAEAARSRAMAWAVWGRDIPYVLLLHIGAFDARMLGRLLALYRRQGFAFTSLSHAEADPAYRDDTDPTRPGVAGGLEGRLAARGLPVPPSPVDLAALDLLCR